MGWIWICATVGGVVVGGGCTVWYCDSDRVSLTLTIHLGQATQNKTEASKENHFAERRGGGGCSKTRRWCAFATTTIMPFQILMSFGLSFFKKKIVTRKMIMIFLLVFSCKCVGSRFK